VATPWSTLSEVSLTESCWSSRCPRDLELQIKLQEREVVTRHVADKREHDRALRIFSGQKLGARRFSFSAQPAEKIQLEGSIGGKREEI